MVDSRFLGLFAEQDLEADEVRDAHQDIGDRLEVDVVANFPGGDVFLEMVDVGGGEGFVILLENLEIDEELFPDDLVGERIAANVLDERLQAFALDRAAGRESGDGA